MTVRYVAHICLPKYFKANFSHPGSHPGYAVGEIRRDVSLTCTKPQDLKRQVIHITWAGPFSGSLQIRVQISHFVDLVLASRQVFHTGNRIMPLTMTMVDILVGHSRRSSTEKRQHLRVQVWYSRALVLLGYKHRHCGIYAYLRLIPILL